MREKKLTRAERRRLAGRRSMAGILTLAMAVGMTPTMASVVYAEEQENAGIQFGMGGIANPVPWEDGVTDWQGNYVYLGEYPQTLDESTGEFLVEPIKWKVLDVNSSANLDAEEKGDAMYLMSDLAIAGAKYYSVRPKQATWSESEVKPWLTNDFMPAAFSQQEQDALVFTSGEGKMAEDADDEYREDVGGVKVFLPSESEMMEVSYGFPNSSKTTAPNSIRRMGYTDYTEYMADVSYKYGFCQCMLRYGVIKGPAFGVIGVNGDVGGVGMKEPHPLAPAVQVDKAQVLFSQPVEGEEGAWELTLADPDQKVSVTAATYKGNEATIAFQGATTGENQQVSAVVTDSEGTQILSYQKVADTAENPEGSGTLTLPEGFVENGYKVFVFSEEERPGVLTDYAGTPQEVTLTKGVSKVESIALDKTALNFQQKWEKQRLTPVFTPSDADNQKVTWTTSDEQVARVTEKGLVMAVNDGTATVTATSEDGAKTATCQVTVKGTKPDVVDLDKVQTWGYNGLRVSWEKGYHVDGYRLYRATSRTGNYTYVTQVGADATAYVDSGLTTGKTYYYKMRAYRTVNGEKIFGGMSQIVGAKPLPRTVKITKGAGGSKQVKLNWERVNGASGYRVYYKTSKNGSWKYVTQVGQGGATAYTHKGLKSGQTCYYKMRAYRTVTGEKVFGGYSAEKSVKVR